MDGVAKPCLLTFLLPEIEDGKRVTRTDAHIARENCGFVAWLFAKWRLTIGSLLEAHAGQGHAVCNFVTDA